MTSGVFVANLIAWGIAPGGMYRRHLLALDFHGYDMLTRILHGFRYTVGAVVVLAGGRIVLSLCLGMLVWFRRSGRKRAPPRTPITVPGC